MSIKNKVTANFPDIAVYDSAGNILGIDITSTINATGSNIGGLLVSPNLQVGALSTAIGNGNVRTGANLAVGTTQVLNIDTSVGNTVNVFTTGTFDDVTLQFSAKGDANIELNSNALFTANVVQGNAVSVGSSLHTLYSSINATSANVGAFRVGNAGNANITTAIGSGNIITGGTTLTLGTTVTQSPTLTISSANTTNSFIAFNRAGTTRYSLGADNTSATGNFVINGPGGTYFTLHNTDNTLANAIITTTMSARKYEARRTSTTYSAGINSVIVFDAVDTNTIPNFTQASGVFTNTSNVTRRFIFNLQAAFLATGTGFSECDIWMQQNATGSASGSARRGQIAYTGVASTNQMLSTSWTFELAANDTVTCWAWAGTAWRLGGSVYGFSVDQSCRVHIAEVL